MASEINGLPPINRQISQTGNSNGNAKNSDSATTGASRGDQISITDTAQQLNTLRQQVSELPEVDQSRVEAIKAAIADGSFRVDPERIAEKFIALEGALDRKG